MNSFVLFDPRHPLVIRPLARGVSVETTEGQVLFATLTPFEEVLLRLQPGPIAGTIQLGVEMQWLEHAES